jgi:hypothetical protein
MWPTCCFPFLLVDSKKEGELSHACEDRADVASVTTLSQQNALGMRLPVYQLIFKGRKADIMRCWSEDGGFFTSCATSPTGRALSFDLMNPAQALELFLHLFNMMRYLPGVYGQAVMELKERVVNGTWPKSDMEVDPNV